MNQSCDACPTISSFHCSFVKEIRLHNSLCEGVIAEIWGREKKLISRDGTLSIREGKHARLRAISNHPFFLIPLAFVCFILSLFTLSIPRSFRSNA
jgi:hypothetical protein